VVESEMKRRLCRLIGIATV